MDTIGHGVQGSLLVAPLSLVGRMRKRRIFWILVALAFLFGVLPDLIGAYGNFILSDNWGLYNSAHSGAIYSALKWVPPYWLHIQVDNFTHSEGFRWWIAEEGLWIEVGLWGVNMVLLSFLLYAVREK